MKSEEPVIVAFVDGRYAFTCNTCGWTGVRYLVPSDDSYIRQLYFLGC